MNTTKKAVNASLNFTPASKTLLKATQNVTDSIGSAKEHGKTVTAWKRAAPLGSAGTSRIIYSHIREKIAQISHNKISEVEYPINPGRALKVFLDRLSDYEKGEIIDYKNIYYLGPNVDKTGYKKGDPNYGYDDERNDYKIVLHDHLAYRYETLELLGKGSFGQALKCFDHKRKKEVAIKIIRNKKRFHKQAVIEAKILKFMKDRDANDEVSIVRMHESFIFRGHFVSFML